MKRDNLILLLDESGSMDNIGKAAVEMTNSIISGWAAAMPNAAFTLIAFSYGARVVSGPVEMWQMAPISLGGRFSPRRFLSQYSPAGQTNLWEAVWRAADLVDGRLNTGGPRAGLMYGEHEASTLMVAITDGIHNHTRVATPEAAISRMRALEQRGNWSFAFNVPKGGQGILGGYNLLLQAGVSPDNLREWDTTEQGAKETAVVNTEAVAQYAKARAGGASQSRKLYSKVTTDLSKLKPDDLRNTASNLSGRFLLSEVDKDDTIKAWYERTQHKAYIFGSIYYMLSKQEEVQPGKELVIRHTVTGEVWGGKEARKIVGLPTDGSTYAKLDPGNHDRYQVFVQSGSTNRKLRKGDLVMIDTRLTTPIEPTWEKTRAH